MQHWVDVFLSKLSMLTQTSPFSSSPPFSQFLCSDLGISLSYSRVNSTKVSSNQPWEASMPPDLPTPEAQDQPCEA